jgi:polyphosphate kinase
LIAWLLKEITEIVIKQQSDSLHILSIIEKQLELENIFTINENELSQEHQNFVHDFFINTVGPELVTIILNDLDEFPLLKDTSGYLAVRLQMKSTSKAKVLGLVKPKKEIRYAIKFTQFKICRLCF